MLFIVDLQGFQYRNSEFLCKEITVLKNYSCFHEIVNFPLHSEQLEKKFKYHINWVTRNIHGLKWDEKGSLDLSQMENFLKKMTDDYKGPIMVKGLQKKEWLQRYVSNNVIDMETEYNCPATIPDIHDYFCSYHHHYKRCSRNNVYKLADWYLNNVK